MFIAIDAGGTTVRIVAYKSREDTVPIGTLTYEVSKHSQDQPGDFQQDFINLVRCIRELEVMFEPIEGIGLAVAGKLDPTRRFLVMAGNLYHWVGEPLLDLLLAEFDCPIRLGNDAEALGLAEVIYGLGSMQEYAGMDMLALIWGTGVGGMRVIRTPHGNIPIPMECGHIMIDRHSRRRCRGCDEPGHIEALCGGDAIAERFSWRFGPWRFTKPIDSLSRRQWHKVAQDMVVALRSLIAVHPVQLIVFSGGVACKQSWLLEELQKALDKPRYGSPLIRLSAHGESAGTLGALALLSP